MCIVFVCVLAMLFWCFCIIPGSPGALDGGGVCMCLCVCLWLCLWLGAGSSVCVFSLKFAVMFLGAAVSLLSVLERGCKRFVVVYL